jgi:hypothetical protein
MFSSPRMQNLELIFQEGYIKNDRSKTKYKLKLDAHSE